jgi:hypothetical protein
VEADEDVVPSEGDLILDAADLVEAFQDQQPVAMGPTSGLYRFLQSFVEEANLNWLLYLGIFLIVASSVFLVASQWSSIPYVLQYLILLLYTSGFYVAAWQMLSRFALRRTGSALIVVTTLLIPLNFWGMQVLGLFQHVAGWLLALPASGWLGLMAYLCAAHVHRKMGLRFALGFVPLAMAQAVIGFWDPWWGTLVVSLLVLGIVWQWTHLPEPPFADDTHRRTTWIYLLGGLAYGGLLTIGRLFAHADLSPADPLLGALVSIWAVALLLVARHGAAPEQPAGATILHLIAYGMALCGMVVARPAPGWLWLSAVIAGSIFVQATRWHGRPFYFYLASLAVALAYFYSPALLPVVTAAWRDHLAASMGYASLPWPFYGLTLFPLALLALGTGRELQRRQHPLARHALGLSAALAAGCLAMAWNDPIAQGWSLALTTLYGILVFQVVPYPGLPSFPTATGLLTVLSLGNWLSGRALYTAPDAFSAVLGGRWTATGIRLLALLAVLWTAMGYRLWWRWRWTPAAERVPPSPWQQPLLHVGIVAAAAALYGGWQHLTVLALVSAVSLAAAHVHRNGLFQIALLVLLQLTLLSGLVWYLSDSAWFLALGVLHALCLAAAIACTGILERMPPPPAPFRRLGRWLALAMDSGTWPGDATQLHSALWYGFKASAYLYGAVLLFFQGLTVLQGVSWAWRDPLSLLSLWTSSGTSVAWLVMPFVLAPLVQAFWIYLLPRFALAVVLLGALTGIYWLLFSISVTPGAVAGITLVFASLALGAVRWWEMAPAAYVSDLSLPADGPWRSLSTRWAYRVIPGLLGLGLVETTFSLTIGTSAAIGWAALVWCGYGILVHPALARGEVPSQLSATSKASKRAAYVSLSLVTLGCYWLLFRYVHLHATGRSDVTALGVPMAVIATLFACLWQGVTWKYLLTETVQKASAAGLLAPARAVGLDWCRSGLYHRLAIGHALLAFVTVTVAMIGAADQSVIMILAGLGVYAALAGLAAAFASWSNRHRTRARAEGWVYIAQLCLACIYAYLRRTTDVLTALDAYAAIVLILGAYILIGVKQLATREHLDFVVRPTYVVSLLTAVGTILTVGWQALIAAPTLMSPMATWLAAGFFTHLARHARLKPFVYAAALLFNGGLYLLWWAIGLSDQQGFLIPAGVLLLWLAQCNRRDLSRATVNRLRLTGLLIIYGSSAFALLQGGIGVGLPALILAVTCVLGILAGIALRIRAYLYLGALFLLLDVAEQLLFFSTQYAPAKWIIGFSLGLLLVGLAVLFESRRETVLARIKAVTQELTQWE